jgi:hypothetical protein
MKGFQFSLRMMLAAVAVVGIGAGLWVAEPSWQVGILQTLFVLALPAGVTVAATQLSGPSRAFCVGLSFATTIPAITFIFPLTLECRNLVGTVAGVFESNEGVRWLHGLSLTSQLFKLAAFQWAFAPVVGLLCVFTHWLFIRPPEPKA